MLHRLHTQELPVATEYDEVEQLFDRILETSLPGFVIQAFDNDGINLNRQFIDTVVKAAGYGFYLDQGDNVLRFDDAARDFGLHIDGVYHKDGPPVVNVHETIKGSADVTLLLPGFRNRKQRAYGVVDPEDSAALDQDKVVAGRWSRKGFKTTLNKDRALVFKAGDRGGAAHNFVTTEFPRKTVVRSVWFG